MSDTEELLCEQPVDEECSSIDEQHTGLDRVNQPEPTCKLIVGYRST